MRIRIAVLFTCLIVTACDKNLSFNKDYELVIKSSEEINFVHPTLPDSLIPYWTTKSNGKDYIIYDPIDENFKKFGENYYYKSSFGGLGRGPFEFIRFTNLTMASNGDLYVYDAGQGKIIIYSEKKNHWEFFLEEKVIDIAVDTSGNILVYHLSANKETVLATFNENGEKLKDFFKPNDQNLKKFLFRFRDGVVTFSPSTNKFYFMYPDSFSIYEMDKNGNITDILNFEGISEFHNKTLPMPENLNPFDISKSHWDYWKSFLHPSRFHLVGDDKILFESIKIEDEQTFIRYYSLFYFNGKSIFEGLVFPNEFNPQVRNTFNKTVLMYLNSKLIKVTFFDED